MNSKFAALAASTALAVSGLAVVATASPAQAAGRYFSSCTQLSRVYPHGVAKSAAAAQRQVRAGYGRPASHRQARATYQVNYRRLDRDRDGTACER